MWYDLYLLVSILTSFSEFTSFSTRIISQMVHVSNVEERALKTSVEIEDSFPFGDHQFGMPNFSNLTTIDGEKSNLQFEMPDFSQFIKRVSDMKCMEYIYEMLKRQEQLNLGLSDPNVTIINGKVVKEAEYPHMGALGWRTNLEPPKLVFLCGASLISDRFMLTAAHCTYCIRKDLEQPQPQLVRLGSRYLESSPHEVPTDVRIRFLIPHPRYISPFPYYDIALIQLDEIVSFSKFIQPACLSTTRYSYSSKNTVIATGWGSVQARMGDTSRELRFTEINIFNIGQCDYLLKRFHHRYWHGVEPHQMCAGELDGNADTCQGDSGGPIQHRLISTPSQGTIHRLLAVTSFGLAKCATKNAPGIYTKVSYFVDWIERTIWAKEYEKFYNKPKKNKNLK